MRRLCATVLVMEAGVSHSADADGSWTARTQRTSMPIALRIEDRDGAVFQDELVLDAER